MTTLKKCFPLVAAAITMASASPALADSGNKCTESTDYGTSCIAITGDGLQVKDVQGWFFPPNNDYLSHRRWGLELTKYPCDPRGRTPGECSATRHWFTRPRRGNPPHEGSMCVQFEPYGIGYEQCRDYGVAYRDAQFGDWRGFYGLPHQFRRATWLCTGLVVKVHRHWRRNGPAGSPGVRGCAEVHD